jgi:hypothetical protein
MGGTLEEAARVAVTIRATTNLGERSTEIVQFVNNHPEAVRAGDVANALDIDALEAGTYLARLFKADATLQPAATARSPPYSLRSVASLASALYTSPARVGRSGCLNPTSALACGHRATAKSSGGCHAHVAQSCRRH